MQRSVREIIVARHSCRSFEAENLNDEDVDSILLAGVQAPSSGNRQPWRFFILSDTTMRCEIARCMRESVDNNVLESNHVLSAREIGSIRVSARVIDEAPIVVLVYYSGNSVSINGAAHNPFTLVDMQGIGACIQNMALAAEEMGIASLWICDVLYAEKAISDVVGFSGLPLVAALALGYEKQIEHRVKLAKRSLRESIINRI